MGYSRNFGGLEREVMNDLLEGSADALAWCKLQRRHSLAIAYRDEARCEPSSAFGTLRPLYLPYAARG